MTEDRIRKAMEELAAPLAQTMGLTLWGVELSGGHGRGVVRVYLDSETGVTVDQCAEFSRDLSVALDVEDVVPGSYYLEVSSPGLDRPFFSTEQMRGHEGGEVQVTLRDAAQGRRRSLGRLESVEPDGFVVVEENGQPVRVAWSNVKKAALRYQFPAKGQKA